MLPKPRAKRQSLRSGHSFGDVAIVICLGHSSKKRWIFISKLKIAELPKEKLLILHLFVLGARLGGYGRRLGLFYWAGISLEEIY